MEPTDTLPQIPRSPPDAALPESLPLPPKVLTDPPDESEAPVAKKRKKRTTKLASKKKATTQGRRRAGRPKGTTRGVNKSQAIRDYLAAHPRAKPQAVAAAMVQQGVDVTPAFVSAVKHAAKKGRTGKRGRKAAGTPPAPRGRAPVARDGALTVDRLLEAKQFADVVGGLANARKALEALERLLG